jgi:hypothetical protein
MIGPTALGDAGADVVDHYLVVVRTSQNVSRVVVENPHFGVFLDTGDLERGVVMISSPRATEGRTAARSSSDGWRARVARCRNSMTARSSGGHANDSKNEAWTALRMRSSRELERT